MATGSSRASGYVDWSLSTYRVANLLDGEAFPGFTAHSLQLYDSLGNRIQSNGNDLLYLPFIDFECLRNRINSTLLSSIGNFTTVTPDPRYVCESKLALLM